ncbi:MAG: hypothetical protein POELPBGB_00515 [Bacteroidia bacterium]|nr:hypothetical protein [Bacteroidia bacterium]
MVALIPVLGFAQTSATISQKTAQQNRQQTTVVKQETAVKQTPSATVILTEEQQHAQWLKNNPQYQTMSKNELTSLIQEFEAKYSNAPDASASDKKEILWMKEILSAK